VIDSTLCLWKEFNESLKVNGNNEYCLTEEDKLLLIELQKFLSLFCDLMELVSAEEPHLAIIPLLVREVKDAARHIPGESAPMIKLSPADALTHEATKYPIKITGGLILGVYIPIYPHHRYAPVPKLVTNMSAVLDAYRGPSH